MRAGLAIGGTTDVPGWSMAVVGILSGLGMLTLTLVNWDTPDRWRTVGAVAVALTGHYVVATLWSGDLGGAMVYLGTGFLVSMQVRWAQFAGMVAGVGAILRAPTDIAGHYLLIVGAVSLAAAAGIAAFRPSAESPEKAVST